MNMTGIDLSDNPFVPPTGGRCIVNELPAELLSHIFTLGWAPERDQEPDEDDFEDVDSDYHSDDGSYSSSSSASSRSETKSRKLPFNVLVSHVCERWRAISLDNPLLWNHIKFIGRPPYEKALTYLDRSMKAPVGITIDRSEEPPEDFDGSDDEDEDTDPDLSIITGIMDIVLPHIAHCRTLHIVVDFYPHMQRALEKLGTCPAAPMLEVFQLYHHEETDEHLKFKPAEFREQPFTLFNGIAPLLNAVAFWGVHLPWTEEGAPFLKGLVDLELAYHAVDVRPSFRDFARILRSSPDLRTLTLSLSCPEEPPTEWPASFLSDTNESDPTADPYAPLTLRKLRELTLAYLEPSVIMALLSRLRLPALTELALDLEDDDFSEVLGYLASARSLPPPPTVSPLALRGPGVAGAAPGEATGRLLLAGLTHLKVSSLPCQHGLVLDAYRQLARLTSLNLNMLYLDDDPWIALLLPQPAGGEGMGEGAGGTGAPDVLLLPRLERLTTTGVDGDRVRALVEARLEGGAPLKEVLMNQEDYVSDEDEEWLAAHLERFEVFEGSDDEDDDVAVFSDVDDFEVGFGTDEEGWEDEDTDDEDGFGGAWGDPIDMSDSDSDME